MINTCIYNFEKSLKLSWLKELHTNSSKKWYRVLKATVGDLQKLYLLGTKWPQPLALELNHFWNAVFKYSEELNNIAKIETIQNVLNNCIQFNSKFGTESIYFPDWVKKGIFFIGDILSEDGDLLELQDIRSKYSININFINYFTIRSLFKRFIQQHKFRADFFFQRPNIPFNMKSYINLQKGGKHMYQILNENDEGELSILACGLMYWNFQSWSSTLRPLEAA